MLHSLTIKNLLLIEFVELEFRKGLNTLTGETGVGKSVLLDCLGFVLGWNNRSDLLRQGAHVGEVIAEFSIKSDSKLSLILEKSGITITDTIILRRNINSTDGRKRSFVNDKSISLDLLKSISKNLVELQGQNDNQSLLNEQRHANFLDTYADLDDRLIEMQKCWRTMQQAKKDHETALANYHLVKSDKDYLEQSMQEILNFDVQLDEEVDLDQKRRNIKAIEKSKEKFEKIAKLICSEQIEHNLSDVIKLLETIRPNIGDDVNLSISALDRTLNEFTHAQEEVLKLLNSQNFDINELENTEERLFKLRALGRKYNVATDQLLTLVQKMGKKLEMLDYNKENIKELDSVETKARQLYQELAEEVSHRRVKSAGALDILVMAELKYLKMADCVFKTEIEPQKSGPRGIDKIVFKAITNRGGKLDKLQAISSGGEMSRFLLALKVCLTKKEQGITMIFDEIDRGIGGSTADAVGRRLRLLSDRSQVIVVTHSPQVAAHGNYQWKVEKSLSDNNLPISTITELDQKERLKEIARMLSGQEISVEALAAAKKLLS